MEKKDIEQKHLKIGRVLETASIIWQVRARQSSR